MFDNYQENNNLKFDSHEHHINRSSETMMRKKVNKHLYSGNHDHGSLFGYSGHEHFISNIGTSACGCGKSAGGSCGCGKSAGGSCGCGKSAGSSEKPASSGGCKKHINSHANYYRYGNN
jgi:hypothetical protein